MEAVSVEEVEELDTSKIHLVDVLGESHFQEGHIPGAINIPLNRIAEEAMERFDKEDDIVVYCKDEGCAASPKAAKKLEKLGFKNVRDFEGGLQAWKEAGNSVES